MIKNTNKSDVDIILEAYETLTIHPDDFNPATSLFDNDKYNKKNISDIFDTNSVLNFKKIIRKFNPFDNISSNDYNIIDILENFLYKDYRKLFYKIKKYISNKNKSLYDLIILDIDNMIAELKDRKQNLIKRKYNTIKIYQDNTNTKNDIIYNTNITLSEINNEIHKLKLTKQLLNKF